MQKISKPRLAASLLILLSVVIAGLSAQAQNITTPYSQYGYGILNDRASAAQRQMGGVGYAMNSGRQINVMNPASYASIDSLTFLFDMGADLSFLWSKDGSAKEKACGGGLDYVTLQFPICKYMGGSAGLLPYSGVGYAFGNDIVHGTVENQGSGGINMAYLGVAGQYAGAALGVNVSYNFGNIVNDIYSNPSTSGRTLLEHVMQVRDWDINIGAQYTARLSRDNRMTIGLTYSPKKSMHGISFKHQRASAWMVEADVTYQLWSQVKYDPIYNTNRPEQIVFQGMKFSDRMRIAVGGEYVPKVRGSYMQRAAYRLGGFFCDDYLNIKGNRVREFGVSAGIGLHTPQDKTMINIGLEWRNRRAHPKELVGENYFNITIGINFNEMWFWKRKIR